MIRTVLLATAATAVLAPAALAQETYITGRLGRVLDANFEDIQLSDGSLYEIGLGYDTSGPFRFELTAGRANVTADALILDVDARATTIMGDVLFDLPTFGSMRPYVGGGYGLIMADIPNALIDLDAEGTAVRARGGLAFPLGEKVVGELGVQHMRSFDLETDLIPDSSLDLETTSVTVGARVAF